MSLKIVSDIHQAVTWTTSACRHGLPNRVPTQQMHSSTFRMDNRISLTFGERLKKVKEKRNGKGRSRAEKGETSLSDRQEVLLTYCCNKLIRTHFHHVILKWTNSLLSLHKYSKLLKASTCSASLHPKLLLNYCSIAPVLLFLSVCPWSSWHVPSFGPVNGSLKKKKGSTESITARHHSLTKIQIFCPASCLCHPIPTGR